MSEGQAVRARRVLRIEAIVDGEVFARVHQSAPGPVFAGTGRGHALTLFDVETTPPSRRRRAAVWLGLGVALACAGLTLFAHELSAYAEQAAGFEAARAFERTQLTAFAPYDGGGRSELALALILLGMVAAIAGGIRLLDREPPPREPVAGTPRALPRRHRLFGLRGGVYYLDVPVVAHGELSLGSQTVTLGCLRTKLGRGRRLRVRLNPEARGKIAIGETVLRFQFDAPAPVSRVEPLPRELVDRWRLLAPTPVAALSHLASFLILGSFFFRNAFVYEPHDVEPSERFVAAINAARFEGSERSEAHEEPAPASTRMVTRPPSLSSTRSYPRVTRPVPVPGRPSEAAFARARSFGIARALGTWGGRGPGTIFDVIQESENDLGSLVTDGTSIVEADSGRVDALALGGKGLDRLGTPVLAGTIGGSGAPGLARKHGRERALETHTSSSTVDIHGEVDTRAVQATIRRRTSALRVCYERALRTQPELAGKLVYTIAISSVGRVTSVAIEEDTMGDASVRACTRAKIMGWRFPTAAAAETAEVTFSVVYSGAE